VKTEIMFTLDRLSLSAKFASGKHYTTYKLRDVKCSLFNFLGLITQNDNLQKIICYFVR
jgi:hypothetical protein